VKPNPFAQVHYNFPVPHPRAVRDEQTGPSVESQLMETDGIGSAVKAGAAVGVKLAEGHVDNYNEEKEHEAKRAGTVVSADAGMSWGGGNGETSTFAERNAEQIPPGAAASEGIRPEMRGGVSPDPSGLGRPTLPDSPRGAQGNWNASDIFAKTNFGRS
jgi:hypothetical protein